MKHLIVLLFSVCLMTSYCSAQEIPDVNNTPTTKPTNRSAAVKTITVTFIPTDTCYLMINGKDYGEIVKSKTIKLPLGNYSLLFESLETGKTIKDRSFRLTRDSVTDGAYSYPVTFK